MRSAGEMPNYVVLAFAMAVFMSSTAVKLSCQLTSHVPAEEGFDLLFSHGCGIGSSVIASVAGISTI